jgi:hypothetical protein
VQALKVMGSFVACVIAVTVLAGCSGGTSQAASQSEAERLVSAALPDSEIATVDQVQQELEKKCVESHGFKFYITSYQIIVPPGGRISGGLPLSVNVHELRTNGYGLYAVATNPNGDFDGNGGSTQETAYINSLGAAERVRYDTIDSGSQAIRITTPDGQSSTIHAGGCYGRSIAMLYGSVTRYLEARQYAEDVQSKINTESSWSAGYISAVANWSHCMSERGYNFPSEAAAEEAISQRYSAPGANSAQVHRYEMAVAASDADCVVSEKVNQAAAAAVESAAGQLTSEETDAVLTWDELWQHALQVATRVLAGG